MLKRYKMYYNEAVGKIEMNQIMMSGILELDNI